MPLSEKEIKEAESEHVVRAPVRVEDRRARCSSCPNLIARAAGALARLLRVVQQRRLEQGHRARFTDAVKTAAADDAAHPRRARGAASRTPTPSCTTRTRSSCWSATILSAQSTDQRVNMVTPALFKRYPNAQRSRRRRPASSSRRFTRPASSARSRRRSSAWPQALVERPRRRGPGRHGRARRAARRRPQDGERRARPRARRPGPAGRSPRAARRQPHRHRRIRRSRESSSSSCAARCRRERWTRTSDTLILHGRRICKPEAALRPVRRAATTATTSGRAISPANARDGPPRETKRSKRTPWIDATFERLVADALAAIPRRFRDAMQNIAIVVEDEPSPELLEEMEIEPPDTLLGLYQGTPLTERALGLRQRAARSHPALPGAARARGRGRGRPRRVASAKRSSTRSATTSG